MAAVVREKVLDLLADLLHRCEAPHLPLLERCGRWKVRMYGLKIW